MRVVLDTNVLISGIFWGGVPQKILDAWERRQFEAYATLEMLEEYQEIIARKSRHARLDPRLITNGIASRFHLVDPVELAHQICDDPDDDMFIACAISAGATHIVSGDNKLLSTSPLLACDVVTPRAFLNLLNAR